MTKKKTSKKESKTKVDPRKGVPKKWTPEARKELGEEFIAFIGQDHVFHITQWTEHKQSCSAWWYDLVSIYEDIAEYHCRGKSILGSKIARLAFENGNNWAIQTFLPKYLDDVDAYLEKKEDRKLERQKNLEKYKNELGSKSHEEAGAKIDLFDKSMELAEENIKLRKLLEKHGIRDEEDGSE